LGVILIGLGGIAFWLRKQRKYSEEARNKGGLI
jgi:hypothetical protein